MFSSLFYGQEFELKLAKVQTTLLEKGAKEKRYDIALTKRNYAAKKYFYNPKSSVLLIKSKQSCDTIVLGKKRKVLNIMNDENSKLYPTDVMDDCIATMGKNCSISRSLLHLQDEKNAGIITFSLDKIKNDGDERNYVFYVLDNNRYTLLVISEFLLLSFQKNSISIFFKETCRLKFSKLHVNICTEKDKKW
ncbi:hypothetical protein [Chryseobacterium sp.]|uniref:hypothetical protein n=1 Tax=Chryseobacterium sp. TaxID=1871047 RepID=UPI0011C7EB9D|nr:hypothetical protein [Chryseobacterium sp.]TXF79612.1 hypothetical protein FUA25_04305 [Chryseobacterium sp.]